MRPRASAQDFPKIAEVIYNRLNMNIKLQLDTTVLYAMASLTERVQVEHHLPVSV